MKMMKVVSVSLARLQPAPWNPNVMDDEMLAKLRRSIEVHGIVENAIVRPLDAGTYEVLSGNQRLAVYRSLGLRRAPCVIVELDDARARLLAQTLNRTRGTDDPGAKALLLRDVLAELPDEEVLSFLPGTAASLRMLSTLGEDTLADQLRAWETARAAVGLTRLTFALTTDQARVVLRALSLVTPDAKDSTMLHGRGRALAALCRAYLKARRKGVV